MLKLKNITKDYISKSQPVVHALKGITINFRRNEFVAILGPSGCGKTTLLNIIGGLDRYTDGNLLIEGKSTKKYTSRDWDTYRNHSIGFIFQSYNLIMHINVLKNVELALTISGMKSKERKQKAISALEKVGLKGLEKKMPNQLSGGQMQRVAIARALVNDPEILLADEPTGALDSQTSIQIMDLLKEVAKDRLVIMVTHNPELANLYATRIVSISDGLITNDTKPYKGETPKEREEILKKKEKDNKAINTKRKKYSSMSLLTSLGLSLNNLKTKKGRTILTSFAGSIGIIGIALILSLSFGFSNYINTVQQDALTSYPISVNKDALDVTSLMAQFMQNNNADKEKYPSDQMIGEDDTISKMIAQLASSKATNDTKAFKQFLENSEVVDKYKKDILSIQYRYSANMNIYREDGLQVYPLNLTNEAYYEGMNPIALNVVLEYASLVQTYFSSDNFPAYCELIPNYDYANNPTQDYSSVLMDQYDLLYGNMPKNINEVVVIVDQYNNIDDYLLISLGLKSPRPMMEQMVHSFQPSIIPNPMEDVPFSMSFEEIVGLEYYIPASYVTYKKSTVQSSENYDYFIKKTGDELLSSIENSSNTVKIKISGIIRAKKGITSTSLSGAIGYLPSLTEYLINEANNESIEGYTTSDTNVVMYQKENQEIDAFTGTTIQSGKNTYSSNLKTLGVSDLSDPTSIYIYPKSFSSKNNINKLFDEYNSLVEQRIREENPNESEENIKEMVNKEKIVHTDTVGTLMTSVQTIVDSVSIVLIAFVSVSLVVSSIMIGIITYVSVLERTKEIGVLRAMGARKVDVANVFNAETFIIGLAAGVFGVVFALLFDIPITFIISALAEISLTVVVPWYGIIILPCISFVLTLISGLIPAYFASKKDPVIALRSE
ncbi:MAG: ATP-binding cassette domain-containing protein [Bacilli bacterium]